MPRPGPSNPVRRPAPRASSMTRATKEMRVALDAALYWLEGSGAEVDERSLCSIRCGRLATKPSHDPGGRGGRHAPQASVRHQYFSREMPTCFTPLGLRSCSRKVRRSGPPTISRPSDPEAPLRPAFQGLMPLRLPPPSVPPRTFPRPATRPSIRPGACSVCLRSLFRSASRRTACRLLSS